MDSLQQAALIAALMKKPPREFLDVAEFDGRERLVAQALKDGKSPDARKTVQDWLKSLGVSWDGKQDVAESILSSLAERNLMQRAKRRLKTIEQNLRWPNLAGPKAVEESLKAITAIEQTLNEKSNEKN